MAEASSMTRKRRLPLLCIPAKASGFFSDQGIMSIRQVRSREGSRESRAVAVRVKGALANQQRLNHLPIAAQVLVFSWGSVLAGCAAPGSWVGMKDPRGVLGA